MQSANLAFVIVRCCIATTFFVILLLTVVVALGSVKRERHKVETDKTPLLRPTNSHQQRLQVRTQTVDGRDSGLYAEVSAITSNMGAQEPSDGEVQYAELQAVVTKKQDHGSKPTKRPIEPQPVYAVIDHKVAAQWRP
jgi:hypothetical protein